MSGSRVIRFGVSIPEDLLKEFDATIREYGFPTRSEAIKSAMRMLISKHRRIKGLKGEVGVIAIIYDHEKPGCQKAITELQHKYGELIVSTLHIHLGRDCMEVIAFKGREDKALKLLKGFEGVKGVKWADILITTP